MKAKLVLLLISSVAIAACSTVAAKDGPDVSADQPPNSAMGPGITIEEALTLDTNQPVLVNGFLYIGEDGDAKLVSLFAESLPPLPGGPELVVTGLNLDDYELTEAQGIRWTDQLVQVLGFVDGSTLTVSNTISG